MDPLTLGLLGGTSLISSGLGFLGSQNQARASREASNQQAMMQAMALQQQMRQYAQTREDLAPYRDTGAGATNMLTQQLPYLTSPIHMDQATLEQTPGYQFNLNQGLKATQSAAAARGLGVSGAALKGAATYATGLADNTYQNQFNNENINRTNAYNRLIGTAGLGASAAGATATAGQNNANAQSALYSGIGTSQGAGTMGAANAQYNGMNAIGQGLNGLTANYLYYANRNGGMNTPNGMYGGGGGWTPEMLNALQGPGYNNG